MTKITIEYLLLGAVGAVTLAPCIAGALWWLTKGRELERMTRSSE